MLFKSYRVIKYILVGVMASCSPDFSATKDFTALNGWFSLSIPVTWQHDFEENVHTFTDPTNTDWAFQVSAYKTTSDTVPDFSLANEFQKELATHPDARIISVAKKRVVYYTQLREAHLLHCWIVGGKRCKAFCSFTTNSDKQDSALSETKKAIASMKLE